MKLVAVSLILLFPLQCTNNKLYFSWKNPFPWTKDIPKEDIKKHVELHLVKKDWKPTGKNIPKSNVFLDRFDGEVIDAYNMFMDDQNQYDYHSSPLENAVDLLTRENGYNKNLESIFVVHIFSGVPYNYFVNNVVTGLSLRNYMRKYNVFAFNMEGMQSSIEHTIIKSIFGIKVNDQPLGETIGVFFDTAIQQKLIRPDQINLLGFCYFAQLAGYIARHISSNNNNRKIRSITALDPYSIGFSGIRNKVISKDDAQVVHAYHTNSMAFGTIYRRATADFSFNSGFSQPGCYTSKNMACSHLRAETAFWYVILYPEMWLARKCRSWLFFKMCLCNNNETAPLTFPPSPGPSGKYYMNTGPRKPYGYGAPGANCYTKNAKKRKTKIKLKAK